MIQETRVRQMVKLAVYDENKSERDKRPAKYYRRDYMAFEIIKSFFSGSIAFFLGILMAGMYLSESGARGINTTRFVQLLILLAVFYVIFMGVYLAITHIIYSARYEKGCRESRKYYHILKRVNECYEQEEMAKTPEEWL